VTWDLLKEAYIRTYELDGEQLSFAHGGFQSSGEDPLVRTHVIEEIDGMARNAASRTDETFSQYLERARMDGSLRKRATAYSRALTQPTAMSSVWRRSQSNSSLKMKYGRSAVSRRGGYDASRNSLRQIPRSGRHAPFAAPGA